MTENSEAADGATGCDEETEDEGEDEGDDEGEGGSWRDAYWRLDDVLAVALVDNGDSIWLSDDRMLLAATMIL